jgi:hypothetical protein
MKNILHYLYKTGSRKIIPETKTILKRKETAYVEPPGILYRNKTTQYVDFNRCLFGQGDGAADRCSSNTLTDVGYSRECGDHF